MFCIGSFTFNHINGLYFRLTLSRKAALELEKVRAQHIARLPVPEDPLRDLQTKPSKFTISLSIIFFTARCLSFSIISDFEELVVYISPNIDLF